MDHAQLLAQGLFPVTTNADEVRSVYTHVQVATYILYISFFSHLGLDIVWHAFIFPKKSFISTKLMAYAMGNCQSKHFPI